MVRRMADVSRNSGRRDMNEDEKTKTDAQEAAIRERQEARRAERRSERLVERQQERKPPTQPQPETGR